MIIKFCVVTSLLFILACGAKEETVQVPDTLTASVDAQASHKDKVLLQQEIIKRQKQEIHRQDRELEDLERQKLYNDSLKRFEKQ